MADVITEVMDRCPKCGEEPKDCKCASVPDKDAPALPKQPTDEVVLPDGRQILND